MKVGIRKLSFQLAAGGLLIALLVALVNLLLPESEPLAHGHSLSEWLDAYDSHSRFDEGDSRRSQFSDEQIAEALETIGPAALPFLYEWLTAKSARWRSWCNQQLARQTWIRFRFRDEAVFRRSWAETGFMYFGPAAQPLLPRLIQLSQSRDPENRLLAYEAAFFTRPAREVFLPLAQRALKEPDRDVQEMAAGWMVGRFPDVAEQAGLRQRFPIFYEDEAATNVIASP